MVYRECPCGDWVCTAEGAPAPICNGCGGYYVPASVDRAERGLAFVGYLIAERDAVFATRRPYASIAWGDVGRYFTAEECQAASNRIAGQIERERGVKP